MLVGATNQTPINQIEQSQVPQGGASGVKENKPPMFLKTISNKLKRGFNNLVLSHNKRVVARAYRSYRPSKSGRIINNKKVYNKINSSNLKDQALNLKFVNTLKGKDLKAFFKVFKSELLKTDNKAFFNNLLPEAKKAFIEQNKGDVEFLSVFSNVYKEELAYDSFGGGTMPELLTAFKDAIISNKDQIIKDPTILAYADKATLESIIESIIKGDEELGKALIQSFFTIDGAFVEKALTAEIKETDQNEFNTMISRENNLLRFFKGEKLEKKDMDLASNAQLIADVNRGYTFEFTSPNGKKIMINDSNNKQANGSFLPREDFLKEIKNQIEANDFEQQDTEALCDFLAHCPTQGMFLGKLTTNAIHIEGDSKPHLKVDYSKVNGDVNIQAIINGKNPTSLGKNILSIPFGNNIWKYEANPNTKANIMFHYNSKLSACRAKADSIKVNSFFQTLEDESFNQLC